MITLPPYLHDREIYGLLPLSMRQLMSKLHLSEQLGYSCGPTGMNVAAGRYCVRPIMNLGGNAEGGFFEFVVDVAGVNDHVSNRPGYFWVEWFDGPRTFTEYINDEPDFSQVATTTAAGRNNWTQTEAHIVVPDFLQGLSRYMLLEAIGDKVTEVSFRNIAVNARQSVIEDYRLNVDPEYAPADIETGLYHSERRPAERFRESGWYWSEIPGTRHAR